MAEITGEDDGRPSDTARRCIGIRAEPKKVTYAILKRDGSEPSVVNLSEIVLPPALAVPDRLRFLRTTVLDILEEYGVAYAGLRLAEGNATNKNSDRIGIEAVLQELLSSSPVRSYFCGRLTSISARLGTTAQSLKDEVHSSTSPRTDQWGTYSVAERESLLVALVACALNEANT